MPTIATPEVKEKMIVPAVSSDYPRLVASYKHGGYEVDYANPLVRTGKNYHNSKAEIPEGLRMSTAGEELAIQLKYEKVANILRRIDEHEILGKPPGQVADVLRNLAKEDDREAISYVFGMESEAMQSVYEQNKGVLTIDPRNAKVFDDLFARGQDKIYMWQWTETFLRVPRGRQNPDKPDYVDSNGRKYWAREFGNGNEVVGVVYVPEGNGRLVAELDEVSGVPQVTIEDRKLPHKPYNTHFWFDPTPALDRTSGHRDVAVARRCSWLRDEGGGCLCVTADFGRSDAYSDDGFRPVRGSFEINAERTVRFG
ncbi:MAG TPA: hypothetical protein VJH04_00650 [archaeon]|nr:hypothetical protein [archaeon]